MPKLTVTFVTLVILLAVIGTAGAAPFQNGSFENTTCGPSGNWGYFHVWDFPNCIAGWVVVNQSHGTPYPNTNGVVRGYNWAPVDPVDPSIDPGWFYPVPEGNWVLAVGTGWGGGIEQTFDTTPGHRYQVTLAASANPWGGSNTTNLLRFRAPGLDTNFLIMDGGHNTNDMRWHQESASFDATAAQSKINFECADKYYDGIGYPFIDNVTVTDMGVPSGPIGEFQNGSFEVINSGAGTNWEAFLAGSTSISGWVVVNQDPGSPYPETNGVKRGHNWAVDPNGWFYPLPHGDWCIAVGTAWGGGIEQTFNTIPGHRYQVNLAAAANPWGGSNITNLLRLRAPGLDTNFLITDGGHGTTDMRWQPQSATFTAAGDRSKINFECADAYFEGLGYPFIDNVTVTDIGPPPPPVVGANNKAVLDSLMATAAPNYTWVLWGKVTVTGANTFTIDDGSGVIINVQTLDPFPHGQANGSYVSAKGTLDATTMTLTTRKENIKKY